MSKDQVETNSLLAMSRQDVNASEDYCFELQVSNILRFIISFNPGFKPPLQFTFSFVEEIDAKLKHSIQSTSRQITRETAQNLDMEIDSDAVDLIAELCWKKLVNYCSDLEAFQKHAKRSTIIQDDVRLLVRNNETLKEMIELKIQSLKESKASTSDAIPGVDRKRKNSNISY